MRAMPDDRRAGLQQWVGKGLYFTRINGQWKVDFDRSMKCVVSLGNQKHTINDPARTLAAMTDLAGVFDQITAAITNDQLGSYNDVQQMWGRLYTQFRQKYDNATWFSIDVISPEDAK
jgi:hypothetical protein